MIFQAHKGVSTEAPENTLPAFRAAIEQGYESIELDVSVTRDLQFILLHDSTLDRTARLENGAPLPETVRISDITYAEALAYDLGVWFAPKFKGTKLPLLSDVLKLAKAHGVRLKIDNKYQSFTPAQKQAFFELLQPYVDTACLTCSRMEELEAACRAFPQMYFHYDGAVTPDILHRLGELLPKERLTVWLPHKNPDTAWVQVEFAGAALAELVRKYAQLGVWILSTEEQLAEAEALGAGIVETNGRLKPPPRDTRTADMHTHSESSHDSSCPIRAMLAAQQEKGTQIFAVTDHFDTDSYRKYDVFTPIRTATETVAALNRESGATLLLAGVEISEGFWHPEVCRRITQQTAYDVIIGSVHLVQYRELTYAYSAIDFSRLSTQTTEEYLDAYFDDVLTMLETVDFDILAHLTCPLRYICGKYGLAADLSRYGEKIRRILQQIIRKGIALEVNTSSFELLQEFMPTTAILREYRAMGGYLITLGSDAHIAENASLHFAQAIETVKKLGFPHIYYYRNRMPHPLSL